MMVGPLFLCFDCTLSYKCWKIWILLIKLILSDDNILSDCVYNIVETDRRTQWQTGLSMMMVGPLLLCFDCDWEMWLIRDKRFSSHLSIPPSSLLLLLFSFYLLFSLIMLHEYTWLRRREWAEQFSKFIVSVLILCVKFYI